jgi:hypothetical protein
MDITVSVGESRRHQPDARYFGRFRITRAPMSLRIPLADLRDSSSDRALDTTQIEGVMIIVDGEEYSSFLVGNIRLE